MSPPHRISFLRRLRAEWREWSEIISRRIAFRKMRLARLPRIWKVRLHDKPLLTSLRKRLRFLRWKRKRDAELAHKAKTVQAATSPSLRKRWKFWLFQWKVPKKPPSILAARAAFFLLLAVPLALLAYHGLKAWRLDNFLDASRSALAQGDMNVALRTAHAAHLMKPEDAEILRTLRNASEKARHHRTLEWSRLLANHPQATTDDQLRHLELALRQGERGEAEQLLERLERSNAAPEKLTHLRLLLTLSRGQAAKPEALSILRNQLAENTTDLDIHLAYWDLCLDPRDPRLAKEGLVHLRKTARRNDDLAREAIRRLLRSGAAAPDESRRLARSLWNFPNPTRFDALLCLHVAYFGKPLPPERLHDVLNQSFGPVTSPADLRTLAKHLSDLGRPRTAESLLLAETNSTRRAILLPDLLQARILSLNHVQAAHDLRTHADVLPEAQRIFFASLVARKNNNPEQADALLRQALQQADPNDLAAIRRFIPLHEDPDSLIDLLEYLEGEEHASPGLRYLLAACHQRLRREEKLRAILARTPLPGLREPAAVEQTCRLKTLYGQDLSACRRLAESLVARHPATASYRYTLALSYLAAGNPRDAHDLLRPLLEATPPVCPTQRLVGAVSLAASGRMEEARSWAPHSHKKHLLAPELALLATLPSPEPRPTTAEKPASQQSAKP